MADSLEKLMPAMRAAIEKYNMIKPDDRIAVGLSGGKDSMLLLHSLALYRLFSKKNYRLEALTLDMVF